MLMKLDPFFECMPGSNPFSLIHKNQERRLKFRGVLYVKGWEENGDKDNIERKRGN